MWLLVLASCLLGCSRNAPGGETADELQADHAGAASYNLRRDERLGGHTLRRHVGKSDDELRQRLREEPNISAASTYNDEATAERVIAATLTQNARRVQTWQARAGRKPNLALHYRGSSPIGRSIRQGESVAERCSDAIVVLQATGEGGFKVLTTYPEDR